jgi:hypothetical protein
VCSVILRNETRQETYNEQTEPENEIVSHKSSSLSALRRETAVTQDNTTDQLAL